MASGMGGQCGMEGRRVLILWRIESESYSMDRFQVDMGVGLEIFPQFGDEHIHASAQEIVVLAPYIQQDLFSFEDPVGVFAKEFQEVCLFLGKIKDLRADRQFEVCIGEVQLTDDKADCFFRMHLAGSSKEYFHAHQ